MPPTFEASRRDLIEHNFSSPAFRDEARQAGVDPAPLAAAWAYLLDQAEIGMMCALGTGGDMVVRLAEEFAPADVRDRVRRAVRRRRVRRRGGADAHRAHRRLRPRRPGDDGHARRRRAGGCRGSSGSPPTPTARRSSCSPSRWARPTASAASPRSSCCANAATARRNGVRIRRLKDKLGTKAVASAEVEFDGAEAFLLAPAG